MSLFERKADRRRTDRRQEERRHASLVVPEEQRQEERRQQEQRKRDRRRSVSVAEGASSKECVMRVQAGQIVKANGKVLQVISRVGGLPEYWRCDDGKVYDESMFTPADAVEIRAKAHEVGSRLDLTTVSPDWKRSA